MYMHGCTVWCKHRSCLMMNFSNYPFSTEEFEIDDSECDNWILHFFFCYTLILHLTVVYTCATVCESWLSMQKNSIQLNWMDALFASILSANSRFFPTNTSNHDIVCFIVFTGHSNDSGSKSTAFKCILESLGFCAVMQLLKRFLCV